MFLRLKWYNKPNKLSKEESDKLALRVDGEKTKARILSACVRLFLEKGYSNTKMIDIYKEAKVSAGSFQNIFKNKEGILTELLYFMYENQFKMARAQSSENLSPACVYAVETAIQMTLTELNENLRDIYIEAYSQKNTMKIINTSMAKEVYTIFGPYQPKLTEKDFAELEIGTSALMRGYMVHPCDENFSLEKKLRVFISESLRIYKVPEKECEEIINFVLSLDIRRIAQGIMEELFKALAMRYEFSLSGILS